MKPDGAGGSGRSSGSGRDEGADVNNLIDNARWGPYQRWLVFLTALTIVFDGADNQLLGIALPAIMQSFGESRSAFAPVVAFSSFGMAVGGAIAGLTGDRLGRRTALAASMMVFGLCTLVVAAADSVVELAALRFLTGIGLGGALPNAAALAAEYVPLRQRPLAVTVTIVCVPLGGTLAGFVAVPAIPAFGWRTLFVIGGVVPIVAALILMRLLPESPRYLAARPQRWRELAGTLRRMGHPQLGDDTAFVVRSDVAEGRAPMRAIFDRSLSGDTLALWGAFFSCLLAVYLGFSWLPSIITSAGLGQSIASTGITLFNFGGVFGALAGALCIARFGSKRTMLTMAAGAVAAALALSALPMTSRSTLAVLVLLTIVGGFINAVQTTMYALAAHVYPTAMRATGVGVATAVGRSGAILSGYAGPWALELGGNRGFFMLIAAAMTSTFLALAMVKRHVARAR